MGEKLKGVLTVLLSLLVLRTARILFVLPIKAYLARQSSMAD